MPELVPQLDKPGNNLTKIGVAKCNKRARLSSEEFNPKSPEKSTLASETLTRGYLTVNIPNPNSVPELTTFPISYIGECIATGNKNNITGLLSM